MLEPIQIPIEGLRKSFSLNQLASLYRVSNLHLRFLNRIKETYVRREMGYERLYFLDFQELFTYAYPFKGYEKTSSPMDFVAVRYLFDNDERTKLVLPDGSFFELVQHFEFLSKEITKLKSIQQHQDYKAATSALNVLEGSHDEIKVNVTLSLANTPNTKSLSEKLVKEGSKHAYAIQRMEKLLNKSNFISLSDLGIEVNEADNDIFDQLYWEIYDSLGGRRPDFIRGNVADAYNIVRTAMARSFFSKGASSKYFPVLITHTEALFKIMPKIPDRFSRMYGYESPLLWTPATAVYASVIDKLNLGSPVEWINRALIICQNMQQTLDPLLIDVEKNVIQEEFSQDISFLLELKDEELYRLDTALKPFYEYAVTPFTEMFAEFERIWKDNQYFNVDILLASIYHDLGNDNKPGPEESEYAFYLDQAKGRLYDVHFQIRKILSSQNLFSNNAGTKSGDLEFSLNDLGYSVRGPKEIEKGIRFDLFKSIVNDVDPVLSLDNYQNELSVVHWDSGASVNRILHFINNLVSAYDQTHSKTFLDPLYSGQDPYIQGVIVYLIEQQQTGFSNEKHTSVLTKMPISLSEHFGEMENKAVGFLRINTKLADFCIYTNLVNVYSDILEKEAELNKVAIITKEKQTRFIAELFEYTTYQQIGIDRVSGFLSNYMKKVSANVRQ